MEEGGRGRKEGGIMSVSLVLERVFEALNEGVGLG